MTFWNRLRQRSCAHRFAWPRLDAAGCHYQICLQCGTAYVYDWKMMRRTEQVAANAAQLPDRAGVKTTARPTA